MLKNFLRGKYFSKYFSFVKMPYFELQILHTILCTGQKTQNMKYQLCKTYFGVG